MLVLETERVPVPVAVSVREAIADREPRLCRCWGPPWLWSWLWLWLLSPLPFLGER